MGFRELFPHVLLNLNSRTVAGVAVRVCEPRPMVTLLGGVELEFRIQSKVVKVQSSKSSRTAATS